VILVHARGRSRADWEDLAEELQDEGYAVLTFDLRGHGGSTKQGDRTLAHATMSPQDWEKALLDLTAAYQFLTNRGEVNKGKIGVIGAGLGANLALNWAAQQPPVRSLVLLSPSLDEQGVKTEAAIARYGTRPVLLVASVDDRPAADAARRLESLARGKKKLTLYEAAGCGMDMLARAEGLTDLILEWLEDTLS